MVIIHWNSAIPIVMKIVDAVTMAEMLRFGIVAELDVTEMMEKNKLNQFARYAVNVCVCVNGFPFPFNRNSFAAECRLESIFVVEIGTRVR